MRRSMPLALVAAMLATLVSLATQSPASAAGLHTVTAQMRLSSGSSSEGYFTA